MKTPNIETEVIETEVTEEVKQHRTPEHEVEPIFLNRWSPRAFSSEPIEEETLLSVFEAAKWAPSSSNEQPWRFIVAKTEADRARFVDFLMEGNQVWAKNAPVLILIISKKTFARNGNPNGTNQFDAGTSWGFLALAALQNGLITHGMAGFYADKAREVLGVPEDFDILAVIALGKRADISTLPPEVQKKEVISTRRALNETIMEGKFQL